MSAASWDHDRTSLRHPKDGKTKSAEWHVIPPGGCRSVAPAVLEAPGGVLGFQPLYRLVGNEE